MAKYDRPLTLRQIAAIQDDDIDFSDIPELDEDFWRGAKLVEPDRTEQITLRVKGSVLAYFKASGKGYQTRINQVLESYVRRRQSQTGTARGQDPAIQAMAEFQETLKEFRESSAVRAIEQLQETLGQNPAAKMAEEMQESLKQFQESSAVKEMMEFQRNLSPVLKEVMALRKGQGAAAGRSAG